VRTGSAAACLEPRDGSRRDQTHARSQRHLQSASNASMSYRVVQRDKHACTAHPDWEQVCDGCGDLQQPRVRLRRKRHDGERAAGRIAASVPHSHGREAQPPGATESRRGCQLSGAPSDTARRGAARWRQAARVRARRSETAACRHRGRRSERARLHRSAADYASNTVAARGSVRSAEALTAANSAKRIGRRGLADSSGPQALSRRRSFPVLHGVAARGVAAGSMLLSASLDALTPRSHVATCRVGAAPGLLVPDGAASRAGAAASVSLRRVPGALQCAQQPHSGGGFLRRAAGGDAASARRRRRSLARGAGVLSVASAAVEETGGAAAAVTESPFSGACSRARFMARPGPLLRARSLFGGSRVPHARLRLTDRMLRAPVPPQARTRRSCAWRLTLCASRAPCARRSRPGASLQHPSLQRALTASGRRSIMVQEEEGLDTKKDRSLVTTADYATQALISWCVPVAASLAHGHA
jgi:hypothetical protein